VTLKEAKPRPGEPSKRLLEITFSNDSNISMLEKQSRALTALFGSMTKTVSVKDVPAMKAAIERGKALLPAMKEAFTKGLGEDEQMFMSAEFVNRSQRPENMWFTITKWEGTTVTGLLMSRSLTIPAMKEGKEYPVKESKIIDFIHKSADGKTVGDEIVKELRRQNPQGRLDWFDL
jgi:uncharacterized protein YegJ (DUF2314 family)